MPEQKPKRKSIGEHFTYAYLRHIKKWMFCPNCKSGKLAFNRKHLSGSVKAAAMSCPLASLRTIMFSGFAMSAGPI